MNKLDLIKYITSKIKDELAAVTQAAKNTYDVATHEDNKPENKYDTRSLEASYLAGAQAKRATEMQDVLLIFENLPIKIFDSNSKINLTALIEVFSNQKSSYVLIMPKGGGQTVTFKNKQVQVITPESPLGQGLMGKKIGDEVEVHLANRLMIYEIISIY